MLNIPTGHDFVSVGKLAGWAAAGDERALEALATLPSSER